MADIIVQPKVLNKDGVTYDNLIMQQAVNATNAENATIAQYASSDTSKGTIEERLTNLGFKYGSIGGPGNVVGTLIRQGNYVFAEITEDIKFRSVVSPVYLFYSSSSEYTEDVFAPKEWSKTISSIYLTDSEISVTVKLVRTNIHFEFDAPYSTGTDYVYIKKNTTFWWEASPIE